MSVRLLVLLVLSLSASSPVWAGEAKPFVHRLFNDHMVFPRDIEAPVSAMPRRAMPAPAATGTPITAG